MYQTIMQDWFNIPTSHSTSSSESSSSSSSSSGAEHAPTNKHTNRHTRCAAIQDDFLWWHGVNDESETSGKLMLVDCAADLASGLTDGATKTKNRVIQVSSFSL